MPNPDTPFAVDLVRLKELAHEAALLDLEEWAPRSLRARLVRVDPDAPVDELIIPKNLFEDEGPLRWQEFLEACWEYKYFPVKPAEGKSIGSIDFNKSPPTRAGLKRWRLGAGLGEPSQDAARAR